MKSKKHNSIKAVKKARREIAISQGAYDGRFAPIIIKNKKKETSKKSCRTFKGNF
ncbi:MAG: hypothetical protein LC105_06810 [Chitinophagales bacterium]|nr:hypothetical protein [Chitinophagales bacterium]MCZ2393547.1 hypothetical protein [Chitinophagales bacterium]